MSAAVEAKKLDVSIRSDVVRDFHAALKSKIIGQTEAVDAVTDMYEVFHANLNAGNHTVANFLFLGPTGSGKTRLVEAAAEILFKSSSFIIRIDCGEFQHSHEIAKLIGSPPGYLGHRETHPLITQESLSASHTETLKLSFLLFDEIEKASNALWMLLLGVLDKATLTLGDNRRVDLSHTVVFLTSNLGSKEISELIDERMGFTPLSGSPQATEEKRQTVAIQSAKRNFSPEFMNRMDRVVVFNSLTPDNLHAILHIELNKVQERINTARKGFSFYITDAGEDFLLREGTDKKYNARHLKRAVERHLVYPMANIIATNQVQAGDYLQVDADDKGLVFILETNNLEIKLDKNEKPC
jgi:ATP-dependent Clp protease ATP-binding subunit ClpB